MAVRTSVPTVSTVRMKVRGNPFATLVVLVGLFILFDLLRALAVGDLSVTRFAGLLFDGVLRGLVIGLAGIGLSMTYSILQFANFAHGDYLTAGAFGGFSATYVVAGLGTADIGSLVLIGAGGSVYGAALGINVVQTPLAVLVGILFAGAVTILLALVLDRVVYRPMRDAGGISLLITSVGVAFALRYIIAFVYGTGARGVADDLGDSLPEVGIWTVDGYLGVDAHDVSLIVVAVGLMLGVHLVLQRTKLGKAMRAMADNKDLARITGIPTERVIRLTWILGAGLTGAAGYMFILWKGTMIFNDGWLLLLLVFAAVILGGIGSIYGAIAGGLLIGITRSISLLWIPSEFGRAAAFTVMILILLFRPTGIFGGRSTA
jgi:branched-chain amino acid transport system permease protein